MGRPTWVVSGRKEGSFLAEDAKRELKVSTVELELEKKKKKKKKKKERIESRVVRLERKRGWLRIDHSHVQ